MMPNAVEPHVNQSSVVARKATLSTICVGFATRGRPDVIADTVAYLQHQTLAPQSVMVSCTSPDDVPRLPPGDDLMVVFGPPGASRQRNLICQFLPAETDVLVFFDDDFIPHKDWLTEVDRCFADNPDVAAVTGRVLADGIKGPGIPFAEACAIVENDRGIVDAQAITDQTPYGCNMAFRVAAIRDLAFDERLVLYGWLEDRDFGSRLAQLGWRLVKLEGARGVHMGVKMGRISGRKFGYSQVMNPFYLLRKGSMTLGAVADHIFRNIASNAAKSFKPEPYIDRRGRLCGNVIALLDLCRGRFTPERAEQL